MEEQRQFLRRQDDRRSPRTRALLDCFVESRWPPHHFWAKTVLAFSGIEGRNDRLQSRDRSFGRGSPTAEANLNPPAGLGGFVSSREELIMAPRRRGGHGRLGIAEPEVVEEVHGQ